MKSDDLMVGDIVLRNGKPVEIVSTSGIEYSFGQQDITIYQGKGNGLESPEHLRSARSQREIE